MNNIISCNIKVSRFKKSISLKNLILLSAGEKGKNKKYFLIDFIVHEFIFSIRNIGYCGDIYEKVKILNYVLEFVNSNATK